jgi:hypothetical protein
MTQVVEADVRQVVLAPYLFEFLGDLALAGIGANTSREDHAIFFPVVSGQGLLGFLPLVVGFQHSQADLAKFDLAATRPGLGRDQFCTAALCLLELTFDTQSSFFPIHILPHQTEQLALAQTSGQG